MKYIFFTLLFTVSFLSCKMDPAPKKAEYPALWTDNGVPTFMDGMIAKDTKTTDDLKTAHTVLVHTDQNFDVIQKWHLDEFKADGWKNVKNFRKNIGQDDEILVIVHTKSKIKHSITALKGVSGKQEIKTVVSKFGI